MMATELWAVLLVIFQTIPGAIGPILVKKGTEHLKFNLRSLLTNKNLILGFTLYAFAAIGFTIALRGGELSVLYPLVSISYVWVCFLSVRYLKEHMNRYKWFGILLIIFGVSMIGLGS